METGNELSLDVYSAPEREDSGPVGIIQQKGCDDGLDIPQAVLNESNEIHLSIRPKYEVKVWLFVEKPNF